MGAISGRAIKENKEDLLISLVALTTLRDRNWLIPREALLKWEILDRIHIGKSTLTCHTSKGSKIPLCTATISGQKPGFIRFSKLITSAELSKHKRVSSRSLSSKQKGINQPWPSSLYTRCSKSAKNQDFPLATQNPMVKISFL
jgi:hypothetical protein